MKTPKRYPATMSVYATRDELRQDRARWKRKNRVKQLKQSLHKYKEGTMLPKLMHIRFAYKWIQELKKPKQNAEVICWYTYLSELKAIQDSINRAVEDAATCLGVAIEREERKEKK
jgi:adenine C2-methylase RlmN of 23S rRNA A2503 and tRNA A37